MSSHEVQPEVIQGDHQRRTHVPAAKPTQQPWMDQEVHDPPEALIKVLMLVYKFVFNTVYRLYRSGQQMLTDFHLRELADEIGVFLGSHPVAAVIVAVMTVACGIPILIYVAFAVITIFLTFSGFLLIEGTVLAAGSVALIVCLITMTSAFTVMGILGAILYCAFMQIASLVGMTSSSESLPQLDSRIPRILASLRQMPSSNAPPRHRAVNRNQTNTGVHSQPPINNGFAHQHTD